MTADLRAIQGWKTWRYTATEDSGVPLLTADADGNHAGFEAPVNVHPYSAVAIRMFGTNTDNDSASMTIYASMDEQRRTGTGPMQELWRGQVLLGSYAATQASSRPLGDGKWPVGTYLEVDTYDIAGVAGGHNAANAVVISGADQAILILPTLGYSVLDMRLTVMDGTGTEITTLGALYREIAMGGVI